MMMMIHVYIIYNNNIKHFLNSAVPWILSGLRIFFPNHYIYISIGLHQKNLKIQVLIVCVFLTSGNKIPRLSYSCKKAGFFSGKNFWFCKMNECLFWGKFWFENCTLPQKRALSAGKRALSAGKGALPAGGGCAPPAPPGSAHVGKFCFLMLNFSSRLFGQTATHFRWVTISFLYWIKGTMCIHVQANAHSELLKCRKIHF
jgi:hypothetical protein